MTSYSLVGIYQSFEGTQNFGLRLFLAVYLPGEDFEPEEGGSKFLLSVYELITRLHGVIS
jgi:hypothetical protein